jgi:hypothetical protein
MKKQNDDNSKSRTIIQDISAVGNELSDEHLRLVAGGKGKGRTYAGRTYISHVHYRRDYEYGK